MQQRSDRNVIMALKESLDLGAYDLKEELEKPKQYRLLLKSMFDDDRHRSKMTMEDLLADEGGRCWQDKRPCFVLLEGCNEIAASLRTQSWLSPLAVDLIRSTQTKNRSIAFEICDRTSTVRLIFQLLERIPSVVRKDRDWNKVQSLLSRAGDECHDGLSEALQNIINLQKEPTVLVLDRPDLSEMDSMAAYTLALLRVVERANVDVKLLITHRADVWDYEKEKAAIVRCMSKPEVFHALRFDQCRI